MKVSGTGRVSGPTQSKKTGKAGGADSSFGDMLAAKLEQTTGTASAQSIARVDNLLSVQAAEDPAQKSARKRMRQRADNLLGELDKIRMGMLNGTLTVGQMIDIADLVASHREKISDAKLTSIMDEIDLRAQVELAKMRVTLDALDSENI